MQTEPTGPGKRTLFWLAILALVLVVLAFALGAETGPDCWKQGFKLC